MSEQPQTVARTDAVPPAVDATTPDALASDAPAEDTRGSATGRKTHFFHWSLPGDDFLLRGILWGLIAAAVAFLVIDFSEIYEQANAPLPGETRQETVEMAPPRRTDQVRPYLPRAMPRRPKGDGPTLPGLTKPPDASIMGERMTFVRGPKGAASLVGRIEPGTALDFAQFLREQAGEIKNIYIHSPGGSVRDAIEMARLIREQKIATNVPNDGYCASSCPLVFSGGTERTAGPRAWIGVHRIYAAAASPGDLHDGMAHGQAITADVQQHLIDMGVDTRTWLHAMRTPSDQLYVFTTDELKELKLATVLGKL